MTDDLHFSSVPAVNVNLDTVDPALLFSSLPSEQSRGWVHYAIHRPEPHILLFRRPLGTDPVTGRVPDGAAATTAAQ